MTDTKNLTVWLCQGCAAAWEATRVRAATSFESPSCFRCSAVADVEWIVARPVTVSRVAALEEKLPVALETVGRVAAKQVALDWRLAQIEKRLGLTVPAELGGAPNPCTYDVRVQYFDQVYSNGAERWALFARGFPSVEAATQWANKSEALIPHVWRVEPTHP